MAKQIEPPPDPVEGPLDPSPTRTIIVTSTPGQWKPTIEFPEWMSPYEVHALLWASTAEIADRCPGIGECADEDSDEDH